MTGTRGRMARGGLLFFAGVSAVLGVVILTAPGWFFSLSWVNVGMPYNPHLLLDYGAMNLALAIPLAASAVAASPLAVRSGLGSYAVWSVAHLVIHLRYGAHLAAHTSTANANLLLVVLAVGAVISLTLFLLSLGNPGQQPPTTAGHSFSGRRRSLNRCSKPAM
ncbi:hypothetical protein [Nocardia cyriacigeorgica]|uniref:hypothetical protein n=1 Tax=Nocardia cyriacigeorgica TaxID=135487 RepID=UPI001893E839|nr:hypothetical protein [Nocardia cyriacigeorgica]MBF6452549.1 hypothetical protein [Nocardia cyriacigeorgica]MBF6476794.1 hypothetical protein [Nocardia cyriacigeorgica]MBF6549718.1 hypothetical protein [Nocardia cyriacigeorgica]